MTILRKTLDGTFTANHYQLLETRLKKKKEAYYDDIDFSFIKKGDVIRSSTHINENDTYFHFMYKKTQVNIANHMFQNMNLAQGNTKPSKSL